MKKILVVVDMQNDFIDGSLGSKNAAAIVPRVVEKINNFDGTIAVTYDTHTADYLDTQEGKNLPVIHCVDGTHGWQLNPLVDDALERHFKNKHGAPLAFFKPTFGSVELAEWVLRVCTNDKLDEVILVGLCTDICVISNAMLIKAYVPEIKVTVDASCCAGVMPDSHKNALAAMKMCQINIENWEE